MFASPGIVEHHAAQACRNQQAAEVVELFKLLSVEAHDSVAMVWHEPDQSLGA